MEKLSDGSRIRASIHSGHPAVISTKFLHSMFEFCRIGIVSDGSGIYRPRL